jgi:anti-sigma B factor antagonist
VDEPVRLSTRGDGTLRVSLRGELGFPTVDTMCRSIRDAVQRARPALVLFDLSEVTLLDSSGMGMLLAVRREADRNGGGGCLVERGNDLVLELLDLAGLTQVFGLRAAARRLRRAADVS